MSVDLSTVTGIVAVIPAAGSGTRMESDKPKQYLKVQDKMVLDITLEKFLGFDSVEKIILVTAPDDQEFCHLQNIDNERIVVIDGGMERVDSVANALRFLYDHGLPDETPVMVHDAARPCITREDLEKLCSWYEKHHKACMLANPVTDTLQKVDKANHVEAVVDRNTVVRALTPQMARFVDLKSALKKAADDKFVVTDEVSALTYAGYEVEVVFGREDNIKITRASDLKLAEFYLSTHTSD